MDAPCNMTERIKKLRQTYLECPVKTQTRPFYYSGDRWMSLGFLEGWLANENALTTQLRRSLAEAAELDSAKPVIYDGELIVGQLYFPDYTRAEQARFDKLYEMFHMSPTSPTSECYRAARDHIALDYEKLLRMGVNGLIREIEEKKAGLDYGKPDGLYGDPDVEKEEFYDCCLIELHAVLRLAERYADHALQLAEQAEEPRKAELLEISRILRKVPAGPAETFREAVQSVHFYTYNMFGLYPLGRPDRYLFPFYRKDMEKGILTREEAQELVDSLCLLVSTYVFSSAASGFIVGGYDENGNLVENDLSYLFLTALAHIQMPDPNGALAVNRQTSDEILAYACDILGEGTTHPAFYNDEVIPQGLMKYGVEKQDACNYIHTTCAEISVIGKSRMYTTNYIVNLPKLLLEYVKQHPAADFEELIDGYFADLADHVSVCNREYVYKLLEAARNGQQPQRASCLIDDCISKGRSVYQDGAKYSQTQPNLVGFANLCDSFIAIRKLVFEEKKLTLPEFLQIVAHNFEGNTPLRSYIVNRLPHYGNDVEEVDRFAAQLAERIKGVFKKSGVYNAARCIPGTFSYHNHAEEGAKTGATFDGRLASASLADGCCPVQGFDRNGPTAMINSLTSWDQSEFLGGMVINVKFNKSNFNEDKKHLLVDMIRAFVERGGIEIQINTVDRQTLLDAVAHPEQHGDLIVRIGGYSDYFVRQTETMQQEIIARTEY